MKQCSRTLLRSPYRVQNLPLTAQGKTALGEHQFSHFCPTEAQSKSFVTLCDQLLLSLDIPGPLTLLFWSDQFSYYPPATPISGTASEAHLQI